MDNRIARLFNHPQLADLALQSLVTLRIFTCLDESGRPAVVLGMLRILGKLELDTGRLALLVGDMPHQDNGRYAHHPINGQPVAGRVVPFWPEICRIAKAGHDIASDRLLIGWDIAVTSAGPVILGANGIPDFIFPQRLHGKPIGEMRFGRLIAPHLDRLERESDRLPPDLRK